MHEADFTEAHYRTILRKAAGRYQFATFEEPPSAPHVLWRHDVDASPHRALALARIEANEGVISTYCVLLHSEFYNLLEPSVTARVREIVALGHRLALHVDPAFCRPRDEGDLARILASERRILEETFECPVNVFSIHNPDLHGMLRFENDEVAGMVNAYGRRAFRKYDYVSDSNGYWRFRRLMEVVEQSGSDHLHVLTHPEWWQAEPMTADQRIDRCIAGRGRFVRSSYDRALAMGGRSSITAPESNGHPAAATPVRVRDVLATLPGAQPLGGAPLGDAEIHRPAALTDALPGTITFVGAAATRIPTELSATMVIVDAQVARGVDIGGWSVQAAVVSPSARLDFIRVVEHFFAPQRPQGIDPSAVVAHDARMSADVYIGPGATVAAAVEIGSGTVVHAGAHLYAGTRIGNKVTIHSGAVIGADGFGYQRDDRHELRQFPHIGGVVIGDNVDIGANTCIDRGTLGDTTIGAGAKIDNLVHIAHNVRVGAGSIVIANATIGGSTRIGARTWVALGATVLDGIDVGEDAVIGIGAVVIRDVPAGATVMGNPARTMPGLGEGLRPRA